MRPRRGAPQAIEIENLYMAVREAHDALPLEILEEVIHRLPRGREHRRELLLAQVDDAARAIVPLAVALDGHEQATRETIGQRKDGAVFHGEEREPQLARDEQPQVAPVARLALEDAIERLRGT